MNIQAKIKMAEACAGISEAELSRRYGASPQALGQRIKTGKFTMEDLEKLASCMGAEFVYFFRFPDGTEV